MKLTIRFREVALTPELLDHVKHSIARVIDPRDVWSLRVHLANERHEGEDWFRCRIEVGMRGGALRFFEAGSSDVLLAIDAAADRLELVQERLAA